MNKCFSICINNIRKWATNPRMYILAILLIMLTWSFIKPIVVFSNSVGFRITPCLLPFLSDWWYSQMCMMFGIVFLFCDAPFIDEVQPYLLIRSTRIKFALGQILYIMIGTAIYFLFITLVSVLIISPNMFLSNDWGKVLGTLAQTNAAQDFHILIPISYQIQLHYTPIQAFALSFLLEWCAGTILGLIMFIVNSYLNRAGGAIAACFIILLDMAIFNSFPQYIYHFSPVSMARLTILDPSGLSTRPTEVYAYIFFVAAIIILSIISVLSVRKRDIQVLPPV